MGGVSHDKKHCYKTVGTPFAGVPTVFNLNMQFQYNSPFYYSTIIFIVPSLLNMHDKV